MGFNYGLEKKKFEAMWQKLEIIYAEAKFSPEGIAEMREYDWERFKERRRYQTREQQLPGEGIGDEDDGRTSSLIKKFSSLSYQFDETDFEDRFDWIQTIENPILARKLVTLTDDDKELLTLIVIDNLTHSEISARHGCTRQAISKRISRVKSLLKLF